MQIYNIKATREISCHHFTYDTVIKKKLVKGKFLNLNTGKVLNF